MIVGLPCKNKLSDKGLRRMPHAYTCKVHVHMYERRSTNAQTRTVTRTEGESFSSPVRGLREFLFGYCDEATKYR